MKGADIILTYCKGLCSAQTAIDGEEISYAIKNNHTEVLYAHCPANWGLDEYIGVCERDDRTGDESIDCKRCWDEALVSEITPEPYIMKCQVCGFEENSSEKFVGIFIAGLSFTSTNSGDCCIYGCPNCGTVKFTSNEDYICKRKLDWRNSKKHRRRAADV